MLGACDRSDDAPSETDGATQETGTPPRSTADTDEPTETDTDDTHPPVTYEDLVRARLVLFAPFYEGGAVTIAATFGREAVEPAPEGTVTIDPCQVKPSENADPSGSPELVTSPGDVVVTVGAVAVPLAFDGFATWRGEFPAWEPGAAVGLAITGDEVPAFDVPALLVVPELIGAEAHPDTIDPTTDLALSWNGAGSVYLAFTGGAGPDVGCTFEGVSSGTVPAEVLGHLAPGGTNLTLSRSGDGAEAPAAGLEVTGSAVTFDNWPATVL